ncbi:MAG: hypothetical protein AB7Q00_12555 [Phycisphaerales bacterium]
MVAHPITQTRSSTAFVVMRWLARGLSLVSLGLLALFAFGGHESTSPTPKEWLLLAFFPIGVALGMVLGWWRELLGGIITTISLAGFYAIELTSGTIHPNPAYLLNFAIFAFPGLMFLALGLWARAMRSRAS